MTDPYLLGIVFFISLFIGSFLNVVGLRHLKGESIAFPASHCVKCNHKLSPLDLFPVLSWLFLGGKCRYCKDKISPIYPTGELLAALSYTLMVYRFGFSFETIINVVFITIMLLATVTDLKEQIVPDEFTFIGILIVLILRVVHRVDLFSYVLGAVVGFMFLVILFFLSGGRIGGADIKIYALIGLTIGGVNAIASFFYACLAGTLLSIPKMIKDKKFVGVEIPFIPFITIGVLMTYVIDIYKILGM